MKPSKNIEDRLKRQFEHVYQNSPFYRNHHRYHGVHHDVLEYLHDLPFTDKKAVLEDQMLYPPFGTNLCVSATHLSRVHKTSGSSETPLLIALTAHDIKHIVKTGSKCFKNSGIKNNDIVIHCLNYNMWAGGYTDHQSMEATGATVIPFGVGNTVQLIRTIQQIKPTAIHCTPSYLKKIERVLQEEFTSLLPKNLGLKTGLFGAESGLQNPIFRKSIEDTWSIKAMNANYGLSEVLSVFASESVNQEGLEFQASDVLYPEIIDNNSGIPLSIENGVFGELVLTNLSKESQPYIRYKTGDLVRVLRVLSNNNDEFKFSFEVCGRVDNMLVIKGINVYTSSIEQILKKYEGVISGFFDILVSKDDPIDQIVLRVSTIKDESNQLLLNTVLSQIHSDLAHTIGVSIDVIDCDLSDIITDNNKIKTIKRIL